MKIISVQPSPHATYEDPEHGNQMLFWDFGKEPERPSYKVEIQCRLLSYEIHAEVDPEMIGSYDKTSKEYLLYTRSTHTVSITPKIRELAQIAFGEETNPYLQAKRIMEYAGKKVNYKILDYVRGRGIQCLLDYPVKDERTGEELYEGCCNQISALFVAMCRSVGIPARAVSGITGWQPWSKEEDLKPMHDFETELSPSGLAGAQDYGVLTRHVWAEFYLPNYGWIPTDPTSQRFGKMPNSRVILSKGRDILIGPDAAPKDSQGYGVQWVPLHDGRADLFTRAVWNIAKIHKAKMTSIHFSDPFPADALSEYPEEDEKEKLRDWRKYTLSKSSYVAYSDSSKEFNLDQISQDSPGIWNALEPLTIHMLRHQLGEEKFFKLIHTYMNLQEHSPQPIPTNQFKELAEELYGESLDWFFNQWVN
ncbi:MAG: hypothetical protein KAI95_17720, partial [Bacteroidales bacterium]|nr:hypothetical protein [Bacteroidales bacterium]